MYSSTFATEIVPLRGKPDSPNPSRTKPNYMSSAKVICSKSDPQSDTQTGKWILLCTGSTPGVVWIAGSRGSSDISPLHYQTGQDSASSVGSVGFYGRKRIR